MMRSRFFFVLVVIVAAVLVAFGVGHGLMRHIARAPSTNEQTVYLYIKPGSTVSQVAQQAQSYGLVREAWHFKLLARWRGLERSLYSGEYEIEPESTPHTILSHIESQQTFKHRLVVPEGASMYEVGEILAGAIGLEQTNDNVSDEGSLLPETYFYERGDSVGDLLKRMQSTFDQAFDELWAARAIDLPYQSREEAVVLASIVEKETGLASERAKVAAVFINRLKKGMRLQSDPTVIYGITGGRPLGRPLSRSDLRQDTPYNTYRRGGLPPTPIANPGVEALEAALNPAHVPYLYFVADGSGGHAFATTLEEHNNNVARWRQIQRQAGNSQR